MTRPKPSEVRARILEQHQVLRLRLDALAKDTLVTSDFIG